MGFKCLGSAGYSEFRGSSQLGVRRAAVQGLGLGV